MTVISQCKITPCQESWFQLTSHKISNILFKDSNPPAEPTMQTHVEMEISVGLVCMLPWSIELQNGW